MKNKWVLFSWWGGLIMVYSLAINGDQVYMVPNNSYQKALDISLKIWGDLQGLHRGTLLIDGSNAQDCALLLDLTVGRMIYLKKCLSGCLHDNQPLDRDDIKYLEHVIEYIAQDAQHLLLYDTDRALSIEQLLQDVVQLMQIIISQNYNN